MADRGRAPTFDESKLDRLYPIPAHAPSAQAPRRFPGVTPESTATLLETLRDNHVKWHIFFNEKHFHKLVVLRGSCALQR